MKYSIVIPTYNHCDDLLKPCIESIFKFSNILDIELIISANGCKDNTLEYLGSMKEKFTSIGLADHFKVVWNADPLGYSRACNAGIDAATNDLIVLLNNDTVLLEQYKNRWLELLAAQFEKHENCGISCIIKSNSEPAGHDFAIFFCVMIHRKVFNKIGLLSLDYGVGGGEDTEFSIECERAGFEVREAVEKTWNAQLGMYCGDFPIYHKGEGTVHDKSLVPEWDDIFLTNSLTLAKKYNPHWYQWRLSNYWERAVFFKGDEIAPREVTRYSWAARELLGNKVFELGCTSGYGIQFLPKGIEYTGLDYDKRIVEVAKEQDWGYNAKFVHGDINTYEFEEEYDTIIAFEVIEHLDTGLQVVEKLKKHCKRLLITVPMLEPPGKWGPHHKLHMLDESFFPGFKFQYISEAGEILDQPANRGDTEHINLMICSWTKDESFVDPVDLSFMREQDPAIYREVIEANQYQLSVSRIQNYKNKQKNRSVIDIGANIGAFSLLAASMGADQVVSVEPISATYNRLTSNINRAGFKNVKAFKHLVSDKPGVEHKVSINDNAGANSMYNVSNQNFEVVTTITLHDILENLTGNDIMLKLDCEGAEYDILLNASDADMSRIDEIMMEIHTDLHPYHKGTAIIEDRLTQLGFTSIKKDQIYYWDFDEHGNQINWRPAPFSNQHWIK